MDSDGLVKLGKAGVLEVLAQEFECLIPEAVYEETVKRGKEEAYEDAFYLEEIIEKFIQSREAKTNLKAEKIVQGITFLGQGEKETLKLYFNEKAGSIVSDDRAFLNLLERNKVSFLTPANLVVELSEKNKITPSEGLKALEKMKPLIRNEVYQKAKEDLEKI